MSAIVTYPTTDNLWADSPKITLDKILQAYNGGAGGGGGGGGAGESGAGSPEGVVTADPGTTYWDTAGQALYAKNSGTGNTGWVLVVTL